MPGINLNDRGAWDDSALVNSWDEALAEYQKYHSIQQSGKRLEDVLSKEELRKLREEHGDLMEAEKTADRNDHANSEPEEPQTHAIVGSEAHRSGASAEEHASSGHQEHTRHPETATAHDGSLAASMPHGLLGTIQDENVKNMMMSWYYAGYYTGLYNGRQQGLAADNVPTEKTK